MEFTSQELLELSAVPIPANVDAVARALDTGVLTQADVERCFSAPALRSVAGVELATKRGLGLAAGLPRKAHGVCRAFEGAHHCLSRRAAAGQRRGSDHNRRGVCACVAGGVKLGLSGFEALCDIECCVAGDSQPMPELVRIKVQMAAKSKSRVLSFAQLKDGYIQTIENSMRFFGASFDLIQTYPDKALALGELGQEEVGRSLTLLAAFSLPIDARAWEWFWKGWSNHQLKAHRAYLYEIISPLRLEIKAPDGRIFAGQPLRPKISQEKEAGLYVDFDHVSGRFLSPPPQVSTLEAVARTTTLAYLGATADAVRRALLAADDSFRLPAFAELAFRICSERIYQQDMPQLILEFRRRTSRHEALVADLEIALAANEDFFNRIKKPLSR